MKLTRDQKIRLENACIREDGEEALAISHELGRPVFRCPTCSETNWLYPHITHMSRKHSVTNYYKTILTLHKNLA